MHIDILKITEISVCNQTAKLIMLYFKGFVMFYNKQIGVEVLEWYT